METQDALQQPVTDEQPTERRRRRWGVIVVITVGTATLLLAGWYSLAKWAPTKVSSPVAVVKQATDNVYYAVKEDDLKKAAEKLPPHVNILVTGLDNRLGQNDNHADAIHLFSIFPEQGRIEVTSVPRDTKCFIDSLFPDSLSHFSNARAKLGRSGYLHTAENFLGKGKIDYWVELNFSTVMGILQLLGYQDPATALQFLRHRKSYGLGDVQRSHNQANFMKQAIIRHFNAMTGMSGEVLLTAGLQMVETNLTKEVCQGLIYKLQQHGFPKGDAIALKMKPEYKGLVDVDLEPETVDTIMKGLMTKTWQPELQGRPDPAIELQGKIHAAEADTARPGLVIRDLETVAKQHAWLQVTDDTLRDTIRGRIVDLLCRAYEKSRKPEKAAALRKAVFHEANLFARKKEIWDSKN